MTTDDMRELAALASHMADEASALIRGFFRQNPGIETKDDRTPVTEADRAAESCIRALIERHRPDDGIAGEEYGRKQGRNNLLWVLDPIDGTKSFIAGRPIFGTLIALCRDGIPVLGLIDQPVTGERWLGAEGMPTTFNGTPVRTRPCTELRHARTASSSPSQIPHLWQKLYDRTGMVLWGGDCYSYGLLSCGWLDMVIEAGMKLHDFAALSPIVAGAGGVMCDWSGQPLTEESQGDIIALGDPALTGPVLDFIMESRA